MRGDRAARDELALRLAEVAGDLVVELVPVAAIELREILGDAAPPADARVLAWVWVDLDPRAKRARIVVVDGARARVLIREVPAPDRVDAVVREATGTIVASAIEALRAGATIGVARADVVLEPEVPEPPPAPTDPASTPGVPAIGAGPSPPATASPATASPATSSFGAADLPTRPPPRTPPPVHVAVELGWRAALWAPTSLVTHGPSLGLALAARGAIGPGAGVFGEYRLPVRVATDDVRARLDVGTLRGWGGIDPRVSPRVRIRARLGGGVDLVRVSASALDPTIAPASPRIHARPIARISTGVAVTLTPSIALTAELGLEVDLLDTRFVVTGPRRLVYDPWRARVGLGLGLAWAPLDGKFAGR